MTDTKAVLAKANAICAESKVRLTEKRQIILTTLLDSEVPLSAYEIADKINPLLPKAMPVASVYRILDFLGEHDLVHKLSSTNKFLACSHIACEHAHQIPQFLICQQCHAVKEIGISKQLIDDLRQTVAQANYTLMNSQLELSCVCEECAAKA